MKQNKLLLIISLITFCLFGFSQNNLGKSDDAARVALTVYVPDNLGDLDATSRQSLKTRLDRIVTSTGLGSSRGSRFILTAKIVESTKEVSTTTPVIYFYELEVTLIIGDGVEGIKFATHSVTVKGAGNSKTKAYMSAIKNIKDKDPSYQTFIENGKKKIIEYYNSNCDFIIKDAQTLAGTKNYDEAMYKLASVPDVCKECYEKCLDKITDVYKSKIENECQQNIAKANTFIAQDNYIDAASMLSAVTPDMQCYSEAESVIKDIKDHRCAVALGEAKGYWVSHDVNSTSMALSSIPSDSKCYSEAIVLAKEVEKYVKETEKRDFEVMKQEMKNEQESKMASIKAARDIGVAYGNNQPKTITTYNIRGWW
jgi:hypothetical protein